MNEATKRAFITQMLADQRNRLTASEVLAQNINNSLFQLGQSTQHLTTSFEELANNPSAVSGSKYKFFEFGSIS